MLAEPPPLSEAWDVLQYWGAELLVALLAAGGAIWKWRGPIATILRKLLAINGSASKPQPAAPSPAIQAPTSIAPGMDPGALARIEDATRRQEREREMEQLVERIVRLVLKEVQAIATTNAGIYARGHAELLAETRRLHERLDAFELARTSDTKELRTRLSELRKIVRSLDGLAAAMGEALARGPAPR